MAHDIHINADGKASFAHVGSHGWHRLGQQLSEGAPINEWIVEAGFDWEILSSGITYNAGDLGELALPFPGVQALYRSDDNRALSIVSEKYQIVQPADVMDFLGDLAESQGWSLETAGVLNEGRRFFGLAKAPGDFSLDGDEHKAYMLIATSCDGSLSTIVKPTDVRVVCNNTLSLALHKEDGKEIRVRHSSIFDAEAIKKQLGLVDIAKEFDDYRAVLSKMQSRPILEQEARDLFSELLRPGYLAKQAKERGNFGANSLDDLLKGNVGGEYHETATDKARAIRGLESLIDCYEHAPGAIVGNLYGWLQGATRYVDHERGSDRARQDSSLLGAGDALKSKAFQMAKALV